MKDNNIKVVDYRFSHAESLADGEIWKLMDEVMSHDNMGRLIKPNQVVMGDTLSFVSRRHGLKDSAILVGIQPTVELVLRVYAVEIEKQFLKLEKKDTVISVDINNSDIDFVERNGRRLAKIKSITDENADILMLLYDEYFELDDKYIGKNTEIDFLDIVDTEWTFLVKINKDMKSFEKDVNRDLDMLENVYKKCLRIIGTEVKDRGPLWDHEIITIDLILDKKSYKNFGLLYELNKNIQFKTDGLTEVSTTICYTKDGIVLRRAYNNDQTQDIEIVINKIIESLENIVEKENEDDNYECNDDNKKNLVDEFIRISEINSLNSYEDIHGLYLHSTHNYENYTELLIELYELTDKEFNEKGIEKAIEKLSSLEIKGMINRMNND